MREVYTLIDATFMIIDAHNHYFKIKDFERVLFKNMDAAGVDKVVLSGLGVGEFGNNEDVEVLMKEYPDRVIGLAALFPGRMPYSAVDDFYSRGFKGLKLYYPTKNYDDDGFMPYYQKAEDYGMPILFHTGVCSATPEDRELGTTSAYMKVAYLDKIARKFPKLRIQAAHLGDPDFLEAFRISQYNPNMWLDLSGGAIFTKVQALHEYLNMRIWPEKLVWGADSISEDPKEYQRLLFTWETLIRDIGIHGEQWEEVFYVNAAKIYGVKF